MTESVVLVLINVLEISKPIQVRKIIKQPRYISLSACVFIIFVLTLQVDSGIIN